jgi:hypothetical protein
LSVDPVIPRGISNPQRSNLYVYCIGNPITNADPSGADPYPFFWIQIVRYENNDKSCLGRLYVNGEWGGLYTVESPRWHLPAGTYTGKLADHKGETVILIDCPKKLNFRLFFLDYTIIRTPAIKQGAVVDKMHECIYVGMGILNGKPYDSGMAMEILVQQYSEWQKALEAQVGGIMSLMDVCLSAGQVGGVLAAFDALSCMSNLLFIWENSPIVVSIN